MKNRNIMSSLTGGTKIFLLVCLGLTFVSDLLVTIVLGIQGVTGGYFVFPLFFTIFDLIFLIEAIFSNFRFAYTVKHLVIYVVFSAILLIFTVIFNIFGGQTIFTTASAALVISVHALAIAGVICCYLYAAKRIRKGRTVQTVVTILFTAVYAALVALFSVFLFGTGYFGQGGVNTRPLLYEYDEQTDTYAVVGVLNGNAGHVYVPAEFNGKRISKVSSNVFSQSDIVGVTLDCSTDVEFTDGFYYFPYSEHATIYADRASVDVFKDKFYDIYNRDRNETAALECANSLVPYDLEKDEVYVTFSYSEQEYEHAKDAPLKTWIGKKGDVFNVTEMKDSPYAVHSDRRSDADLLWNFVNNEKYILSKLPVNGQPVTESFKGVPVEFERVYKILPGESNDEVHTTELDFGFSVVASETLGCKLTVSEYADEILADFHRDGFELEWFYSSSRYPNQWTRFTSLSDNVLRNSYYEEYPDYTIYPNWEMNDPMVSLTTNGTDNSFIYGDDALISAVATSEVENVRYEYSWWRSSKWLSEENGATLSLPCINRNQSATYEVQVTATSPDSSLSGVTTEYIYVDVDPRPVNVSWNYPVNTVFDGTDKITTCQIRQSDVINGDNISLKEYTFERWAAGSHTFTAQLAYSSVSYNYTLVNDTGRLTIDRAPLTVVWGDERLVYGNAYLCPTTELRDVCAGATDVSVSSTSYVNAGEYEFRATLSGSHSANYYIVNPTHKATIERYGVTVSWNINASLSNGNETTYNGSAYSVTAHANGVNNVYIPVNTDRSTITNAGTYEITATLSGTYAINYYIEEGETQTYIINPRPVTVNWKNSRLTYNGYYQHPDYEIVGANGARLQAIIECNGKDAGTGYTATATAIAPSSAYLVANYSLSGDTSVTYSIERLGIDVSWGSLELVYNGKPQAPEAYIDGLGSDGKLTLELDDYSACVNVGTYHVVADQAANKELYPNYLIIANYTDYKIVKRTLTYKATDVTIYEGDPLPQLTYTYSGFINGEENVGITVSDIRVTVENFEGKVGTYKNFIIITGNVSGDGVGNYNVVFEYGTLTVLPREGRNAV